MAHELRETSHVADDGLSRQPAGLPDPDLTENGRIVLEKRYLRREGGRVLETPGGGFWRVADDIGQGTERFDGPEAGAQVRRDYYLMMARGEFLPNSPTLMNAGKGNGLQYSACYVLPVPDSMDEIFETNKRAALIHQSGGGTGFAFSRLRPAGDVVGSTGGVASGPVSFLEVYNASTESVKQGGTRRGANMGILRVDHPDILKFVDCKKELNERHRPAYDAVAPYLDESQRTQLKRALLESQISNFNISVGMTDGFMEALAADSEFELVNPRSKEVQGKLRAREVFDRMVRNAWETGDPGIIFLDRVNSGPANPVPEMGPVEATNPCVTGDTLIYTAGGLRRAADLSDEGLPVRVTVEGEPRFADASSVFRTGRKAVFRLSTYEGYEVRLTADHRVMTRRGWVPAGGLRPDDEIRLLSHKGGFGTGGSLALGQLFGWLVGEGTLTADRAVLSFAGEEKRELAPAFAEMMEGAAGSGQRHPIGVGQVLERDEVWVRSARFWQTAAVHGLHPGDTQKVPDSVLAGSEEMQRGFLQALFTADGGLQGEAPGRLPVRLSATSKSLLRDVQRLLLNFGIVSSLRLDRPVAGAPSVRRDGMAGDGAEVSHELVISRDNLLRFAGEIGFLTQAKQARLLEGLETFRRGLCAEPFYARFVALEPDGEEYVYDLTEPITSSFVGNGLMLHNCGEQPLYPNEACNLGSINLAKFVRIAPNGYAQHGTNGAYATATNGHYANGANGEYRPHWRERIDWDRLVQTTRLAIRFLDDVVETNPYPDEIIDQVVKANRRIGLGVMGWADLLILLEIPYDTQDALDLGQELMRAINEAAHDESCRLAERRGPFPNWSRSIYKDGRPQRNATVTTIAPTGTISIIAGCSSGIEPIFALVFDRRGSLDGQLKLETNQYLETMARRGGFWTDDLAVQVRRNGSVRGVDAVPEHWQRVFGTSHDIDPEWHVRMQGVWQKHTDNAVSKTINLPHDATIADVEKAYRLAYELGCNGITVYRDGSKEGVLHIGSGGPPAPAAVLAAQATAMKGRPKVLQGTTYQEETPLGTAYVTVNHAEDGQPYEVFVNQGKTGSDMAAMSVAIGKLASLVLGLPSQMTASERLREVARRLRGIGGSTSWGLGPQRARSLPDALAKVIETHLDTQVLPTQPRVEVVPKEQLQLPLPSSSGEFCPDCNNTLAYEEGCSKCFNCGFSKC